MAITILIPTALRAFADAQARVEVEGRTVGEVLAALVARHAALAPHLFDRGCKSDRADPRGTGVVRERGRAHGVGRGCGCSAV